MDQVIKKSLVLTFKSSKGKDVKVTINRPKADMNGKTISDAMDNMIAADALGEEGKVVGKETATYVTQQSDTIELE